MIVCKLYNLYKIILIYHPFKQFTHFIMVDGEFDGKVDDVPPNTPTSVPSEEPEEYTLVNDQERTPGNAVLDTPLAPITLGVKTVSQGDGYLFRLGINKNGEIKRPSCARRIAFNNPNPQDC
jgi:hypothetical protein